MCKNHATSQWSEIGAAARQQVLLSAIAIVPFHKWH